MEVDNSHSPPTPYTFCKTASLPSPFPLAQCLRHSWDAMPHREHSYFLQENQLSHPIFKGEKRSVKKTKEIFFLFCSLFILFIYFFIIF